MSAREAVERRSRAQQARRAERTQLPGELADAPAPGLEEDPRQAGRPGIERLRELSLHVSCRVVTEIM